MKVLQYTFKVKPFLKDKASLLFLLTIGLFTACQSPQKTAQDVASGPYFSLDSYFNAEITRLRQQGIRIDKRIELDGEVEDQTVETVDFDSELKLFREADINRPAWTDKYTTDSIMEQGQLQALRYTTQDSTLPTQLIHIQFAPEGDSLRVTQLNVRSRMETALSSSDKTLEYLPEKGYRIEAQQRGRMTSDVALKLEARFRPKTD